MKSCEVLVLADRDAKADHDRVIAICLPLNLRGRGADAEGALSDLARAVIGFQNSKPGDAKAKPPDPRLQAAYRDDSIHNIDGLSILRRTRIHFESSLALRELPPTAPDLN